jgi:hypothetical protein
MAAQEVAQQRLSECVEENDKNAEDVEEQEPVPQM